MNTLLEKRSKEDATTAALQIFETKKFSMITDEGQSYYQTNPTFQHRHNIVSFDIEAHVCVQQTCLDLLEQGIIMDNKDNVNVHVVADCVSSQQGYDCEIALRRMENTGAFITTAQSLG